MSQQLLFGIPLKASTDIEALEEWKGESGDYAKTFALNDKRNKNGWRVTWDSIPENIPTFIGKPGIEFVKCEENECDLDHTDAETYEQSLKVQEPFRVSTIVDYTIDETTKTAFFIHKFHDHEFFEKVKSGEVKAVSPSIWPQPGGFEILGQTERGMPMIDVFDWKAIHDAFVNKPAFGDDAKIRATCEGEGCMVKLLSAKELKAEDDPLAPLKQVSLMIRHKDKIHFISVNETVQKKVQKLLNEGKEICEKTIVEIIKNDSKQSSSFRTCNCTSNQKMPDITEEEHNKVKTAVEDEKKKVTELESKLKGMEEDKEKQHTAKKARHAAVFKAMEEDEEKTAKYKASVKAMEDEDELKAMDEAEKEHKTAKKGMDEDPKKKELEARLVATETKLAEPLIAKMVKARELKGADEDKIKAFKQSLQGKSLKAVEEKYADEEILIEQTLSAAEDSGEAEEKKHFNFSAAETKLTSLAAKSLEEIFEENAV